MPVKTTIAINDKDLVSFKIARIEGGLGMQPDDIHTYSIYLGDEPDWQIDYEASPLRVTHRYGDGAAVLTSKALQIILAHDSNYGKKIV